MIKNHSKLRFHSDPQFNMTPMIDVVFLLIIFFMLICQFIVQENYKLVVPDECANATVAEQFARNAITVSVFSNPASSGEVSVGGQQPIYAVRSLMFDPAQEQYAGNSDKLLADLTACIVDQSRNKIEPIVYLRADRDMSYGDVQNVLLALAHAGISKVQLAAFRTDQNR